MVAVSCQSRLLHPCLTLTHQTISLPSAIPLEFLGYFEDIGKVGGGWGAAVPLPFQQLRCHYVTRLQIHNIEIHVRQIEHLRIEHVNHYFQCRRPAHPSTLPPLLAEIHRGLTITVPVFVEVGAGCTAHRLEVEVGVQGGGEEVGFEGGGAGGA